MVARRGLDFSAATSIPAGCGGGITQFCRSIFKVIKKGLTLVEAHELADTHHFWTIRAK